MPPPSAQDPAVTLGAARIAALRAQLDARLAAIREDATGLAPHSGFEVVHAITKSVDRVVLELAEHAEIGLETSQGPNARALAERVEIVALGGYGRNELCPWSDVDLLFLVPKDLSDGGEVPPAVRQFVEGVLYGLWDLGIEVGQTVRTVDETIAAATEDVSVLTSLFDARLLVRGDALCPLLAEVQRALHTQLLTGPKLTQYIEAKLVEARERRARFGDTVFLLEPNIKESEGGLREMHSARWVARARWRVGDCRELVRIGRLSSREGVAFDRAYGFLLRVRAELHFLAKRRQDHLRFEYQEQIAPALGYVDSKKNRQSLGVERFMGAYYFAARQLRLHAGLVVERATSHNPRKAGPALPAPGGFKFWDGKLTVSGRDHFKKDATAILRIFRVAQEERVEIYSYTKNLIVEHTECIDGPLRRDPRLVTELLDVLEYPKGDGTILEVMHDLGVLRRLIPEFSRITARWQHSLYHVYTVDVHSLGVFKNLKRLRMGAYAENEADMTRLCAGLPRPAVLYLAGLLHDVGKGWRGADHSERGVKVAKVVGRRFEQADVESWTETETADLAWLVGQHLTMSDISQRRDLSDPALIESFAQEARTQERLTMLYLLTFADMKGTSPKVWTDWKRGLLRELYLATRSVLQLTTKGSSQIELHFEARRRRAERALIEQTDLRAQFSLDADVVRTFVQSVPARYMLSFGALRMVRHAQMWRDVSRSHGFALHVRHMRRDGTTKLTVVCPDRPGLLALIAGTLAAHSLQIVGAQVYSPRALQSSARPPAAPAPARDDEVEVYRHFASTEDAPVTGYIALDVLFVTDAYGKLCDDHHRWNAVREDLQGVLAEKRQVESLLARRRGTSGIDERHRPAVKTRVTVVGEDSNQETVIDVFCEDRIGTLYTLANTLAEQGLSISLAKISTQGHRVADGFYVTDAKTGLKIESQERLQSIRQALQTAVDGLSVVPGRNAWTLN